MGFFERLHAEYAAELPGWLRLGQRALPVQYTHDAPPLTEPERPMIAAAPTDLDLFTREELRAGLRLILTSDCAADVMAGIAAIPEPARPFYRWGYELVLAVSDASPAAAERVRERFGSTPDERDRIAAEQRIFRGWKVATASDPWQVTLGFADLVIDTRNPTPSARAMIYAVPTAGGETVGD